MLQQLAQLTVNGLITGTILALAGVGATLVFGIQRIANFAHGEYLTFAAYAGLFLGTAGGQGLVVATLGAMVATALLAVGLHFIVLKPLRGRLNCALIDVAPDPAAAELLRDGSGGAGAQEAVQNKGVRIRGNLDNSGQKSFRLLSGIAEHLL